MSFGRLERTKAHEPMSEINVTPLVDVMLVLLVIFIITAPLLANSIKLNLPKAQAAKAPQAAAALVISLDESGKIYLTNESLTLPQLTERFAQTAKDKPETEVHLRADEKVAYGKVLEIIGLAQKAGLSKVGFVASPLELSKP